MVGTSAGGPQALTELLSRLPPALSVPVLVVQHLHGSDRGDFCLQLGKRIRQPTREPFDKEPIRPGYVYTAPADYHLLVGADGTFNLSVDARVNGSRPAIDLLFESAAGAWGGDLTAVILTGANRDGAAGIAAVKAHGGITIAQDPNDAEIATMPNAAIETGTVDHVLPVAEIGDLLAGMLARAGSPENARQSESSHGKIAPDD